ncbi:MAG: hypothetical protein ABIN48_01245, partial [Ginsengibacter sp.]
PPCTERYARWCERTGSQLMATFLLDFFLISHIDFNAVIHVLWYGIDLRSILWRLLFECLIEKL